MVVSICLLDLQLPVQSVDITTKDSSNSDHGEVYSIQHYMIKIVTCRGLVVLSGFSVSSTNKTDRRVLTELLLQLALNIITITLNTIYINALSYNI